MNELQQQQARILRGLLPLMALGVVIVDNAIAEEIEVEINQLSPRLKVLACLGWQTAMLESTRLRQQKENN